MRKKISVILALVLIPGVFTLSAHAAGPANGVKCNLLNSIKGIPKALFICAQEGKNRIWRPYKATAPKPTTAPAPQSSGTTSTSSTPVTPETPAKVDWKAPKPISIPVAPIGSITFDNLLEHINDIPEASYNSVKSVMKANSPVTVPNSVYIGPTTQLDIVGGQARIQTILARDAQLWSGFAQPTFYAMYMYNAADEPTTEEKFTADFQAKKYKYASAEVLAGPIRAMAGNCQKQIKPGAFTGPLTECRGANSGSYFESSDSFLQLGNTGSDTTLNKADGVVIAHEYIHAVVASQWINSPHCVNPDNFAPGCNRSGMSNRGFSPCWLFEGLPNAAGSAVAEDTLDNYLTFRKGLPYGWGPTNITDYSEASLKDFFGMQNPNSCYQNGPLYVLSYSIGALATEALISIGGPQSVMAVYALGAEGQDFETAFEKVYGISWNKASAKLAKLLAAEYATYGPAPR